jgi:hypothetical protein
MQGKYEFANIFYKITYRNRNSDTTIKGTHRNHKKDEYTSYKEITWVENRWRRAVV